MLGERPLAIDYKSKMTPIVGGLCTALLECKELVSYSRSVSLYC